MKRANVDLLLKLNKFKIRTKEFVSNLKGEKFPK